MSQEPLAAALEAQIEETAQDVQANSQTLPATAQAKSTMSLERLAALIQAHQRALLAHPEAQATHEAMISRLRGVDTGEITLGQCVRVLRYQAVLVAEVPAFDALSPGSGRPSADAAKEHEPV